MKKRTLEEIHEFNRKLKKKHEEECHKRWEEERNKPKNMKSEAAKKRYLSNSELRALNHFKAVLQGKCTLDDFIKNRCYCKRCPTIKTLHKEDYIIDEKRGKRYLNNLIEELDNKELFIGFIEFIGNWTKPIIDKSDIKKHKLLVKSYKVNQRYGLIVMYYNNEGKFFRFILNVELNIDHKVTELEFIHDASVYNYIIINNLKLPPERKKVTHYKDGLRILYSLTNGQPFHVNTATCKYGPHEAVAHAEENIVKYRIDLDKKPKILIRRCPKCGGYLEKIGKGIDIVYRCYSCDYVEYQNVNPNEPIMKCPECKEGDAIICYKWNKKKKKVEAYIGCSNAPGCTLHINLPNKK